MTKNNEKKSNNSKSYLEMWGRLMYKLQTDHILSDLAERNEVVAEYHLVKIPEGDVEELRNSGKPGFILKQTIIPGHPEYWYSPVEESFSLVAKKWYKHNCGECALLGTMEGSSLHTCAWANTIKQGIKIEKFEYLENACITFGMSKKPDVLKINKCSHFKPYPPKNVYNLPIGQRKKNALMLAQHLDPSLETVRDLDKYIGETKRYFG